jgi:hypothetical protein
MTIPLKSEKNSDHVSFACPSSLKRKLEKYAKKNNVTSSAAARHILSLFFSGNSDPIEVKSDLTSEDPAKIPTQQQKVASS